MTADSFELKIDATEAQAFLKEVANAARAQFAMARAGDTVFVEMDRPVTADAWEAIARYLAAAVEGTGVRCVLLHHGLKVARINLENPPEKV
jgi:hypothetical protein